LGARADFGIVTAVSAAATKRLALVTDHVGRLRACHDCPDMIGPVVTGAPVLSPVMLIGQAPGSREGPAGKPFAWTAGKTMFGWFAKCKPGLDEDAFRARVYMAAVCRCFPGKGKGGGDRVPAPDEVARCARHLAAEVALVEPKLVIPVGKLAIAQVLPELADAPLVEVIGPIRRVRYHGRDVDVAALPHPSGASTWHRMEPGVTLLARALGAIAKHPAWKEIAS
jgi:uracil-DNA glycosylase